MPELPDVAGFEQYVKQNCLHERVAHTSVHDRRLLDDVTPQKLSRRLKDRALTETARHGKYLFVRAKGNGWLVLHFGMTGNIACFNGDEEAPGYAAVELEFANGDHLAYISRRKLGRVSYTDEPEQFVADHELGPDALSDELDRERFAELLTGRSGMLKSALMNQSIIAGLGNVWTDEVLFQAKLHPKTPVDRLDERALHGLHRVMRRVLHVGADRGGRVDELPRGYLLPHREEKNASCPKCGGKIRTMTVAGRTTHYCPKCQEKKP